MSNTFLFILMLTALQECSKKGGIRLGYAVLHATCTCTCTCTMCMSATQSPHTRLYDDSDPAISSSHRHRQLCRCAYAIPTCPHRTDLGEVTHNTSGITIWHPGRLAGDGEKGQRRGTNNSATATSARARSSGPPSLPPAEALQGGEVCCPGSTAGPWRDQVDTQRRVAQA